MMIGIISEHVAAGAERSPTDACFIKLINDRSRLLFRIGRDDPIDRAANTQTRQIRKTLSALRTHTQPRRQFFNDAITFQSVFIR